MTCIIEGCEKPAKKRDRHCSMHRARITRHGDPHKVITSAEKITYRGADSPTWSETPTYGGMHQRLRTARGPANTHTCRCGAPAKQWSYDRADPAELPGPPGPYSLDLSHYVPLCVPCHKVFDLRALGK